MSRAFRSRESSVSTVSPYADCGFSTAYYNTSIVLDHADPDWAARPGTVFHGDQTGRVSSAGTPSTPDGGVTWEIPEITMFESDFSIPQ